MAFVFKDLFRLQAYRGEIAGEREGFNSLNSICAKLCQTIHYGEIG